jgi:hypothetical protein
MTYVLGRQYKKVLEKQIKSITYDHLSFSFHHMFSPHVSVQINTLCLVTGSVVVDPVFYNQTSVVHKICFVVGD